MHENYINVYTKRREKKNLKWNVKKRNHSNNNDNINKKTNEETEKSSKNTSYFLFNCKEVCKSPKSAKDVRRMRNGGFWCELDKKSTSTTTTKPVPDEESEKKEQEERKRKSKNNKIIKVYILYANKLNLHCDGFWCDLVFPSLSLSLFLSDVTVGFVWCTLMSVVTYIYRLYVLFCLFFFNFDLNVLFVMFLCTLCIFHSLVVYHFGVCSVLCQMRNMRTFTLWLFQTTTRERKMKKKDLFMLFL